MNVVVLMQRLKAGSNITGKVEQKTLLIDDFNV